MCIAVVEMMLICVGGREQSSFLPRPIAQPNSYAQFGQQMADIGKYAVYPLLFGQKGCCVSVI